LQSLATTNDYPVLETQHLCLRRHRLEDFPACRDMWADPRVTHFIGGRPLTREEAWLKFQRNTGHWPLLGFGFWVIEEKSSGNFAGEAGVSHFFRETQPPVENLREAGWIISPAMQGRGYATEAVNAVLAWTDARLSDPHTICLIHPENLPSLRVAAKCGFRTWFHATYQGEPCILFRRTR
jgi:RimJ/RimL family protein N-acetyltransferase